MLSYKSVMTLSAAGVTFDIDYLWVLPRMVSFEDIISK